MLCVTELDVVQETALFLIDPAHVINFAKLQFFQELWGRSHNSFHGKLPNEVTL